MSDITVRYFAAAADAAGSEEEILSGHDVRTLGELKALLESRYGADMQKVMRTGSFLVDGIVRRNADQAIGSRVDVLPPFAGG